MTAQCISPIQGTRARIMRLDSCAAPVTGAGSLIVFDGFVSVAVSPQYEDGVEYTKKQANGVKCVNRKGNDQFSRDQLTIEFCAIDPDAVVITTGQSIVVSGATGTGFWVKEGEVSARWSLEIWQADSETCTGASPRYAYWVWPHLAAGRLNDFTVEDDVISWQITASSAAGSTSFNVPGTSKPIPFPLPTGAHRGFNINTVPPPTATGCGAQSLSIP